VGGEIILSLSDNIQNQGESMFRSSRGAKHHRLLLGVAGALALLALDGLSLLPEAILAGGIAWVLWSLLPERRNAHVQRGAVRTPSGRDVPIGPAGIARPTSIFR
jgi:hypothetical protein